MAVYTTIDNPELYFQVKIWTGTGSSNALTLDGSEDMQPDYVMIKQRSSTQQWNGYDVLRGVQKYVGWNTEIQENTQSQGLTAFGSDGFTVGTDDMVNKSSSTYVAYCWKANGSGSSDTNGSVNSIATSANTTSGVSISYFNLSGESGEETVGHGLGVAPDFIFAKTGLDKSGNSIWWVYHKGLTSASYYLSLAGTGAQASETQAWGGTAPTSSVFTVGDAAGWGTYKTVAYCFADVQGFSKFGSYTGNGNADGTFVYTGFKPNYLLIKRINSAEDWMIFDIKRSPFYPQSSSYSGMATRVSANNSNAEDLTQSGAEWYSNGFKWTTSWGGGNGSGDTYIYLCFGETFVNSKGVPCNAR
jgi:hypothetical protein